MLQSKRVALALTCLAWVSNPYMRRMMRTGSPACRRMALNCRARALVNHDRVLHGRDPR